MMYEDRWSDFPDYIIGVTKEIWEDRRISTLKQYYHDDIVVRSPASVVIGNQGVIAATMATLAEFPDRQLLAEDVIWTGDPATGAGMLSSHRLISLATHTGDGAYGPATGRKLAYRIIADCHVRGAVIDDEWLVRDQGAIVRQMGWDLSDHAARLIAAEGGPEGCVKPLTPLNDRPGPYSGTGNDDARGVRLAEMVSGIMNADMAAISRGYDRACHLEYSGGVTGHGHQAADRFWMGLRAAFPSAEFRIEHAIGRDDAEMPPRAAVRWSLWGKHDGWGAYGKPTGAQVYVLGMTQAEFGPWGLRREHTLVDELAIWKQIRLHTG
ncbi:MAG: ester cyclase [Paracoccaceae bacterium]